VRQKYSPDSKNTANAVFLPAYRAKNNRFANHESYV
jgi:hypothetical protein